MTLIESEDEGHTTDQNRLRSWSMLEMQEIHTIHHLSDNMESILCKSSSNEVGASKSLKDVNGEDQGPDFLFYDFKDDDDSSADKNNVSTEKNSIVKHNLIQKLSRRHKNHSFAFGDGSMESMAIGLDTAHHIHQDLKLDEDEWKDDMDDESVPKDVSSVKTESHIGGTMLSEYRSCRKDQTSPNEVLGVVQLEKEQPKKQPEAVGTKDSTTHGLSPSMDKLARMMDESYITKSQGSTNKSIPTTPSRKLPALLAPKTMPKLKNVVQLKPPQGFSDNSNLDSSNGSSTASIGSADGMRKSILKKSGSIGKFSKETDTNDSTGREGMRRTASFSTLEIRSYDITIGDNPGGSHGAPVSLSWDYNPDNTIKVDLDTYEKTRPQRRARSEMYMSGSIRMFLLMKTKGYTLRDIEAAAKEAEKLRKKRQNTIKKEQFRQSLGKIFSRSK